MNYLFVVDKFESALWHAATARASIVNGLVLAADTFKSPKALIQYILESEHDTIIFSWRRAISDIAKFRNLTDVLNKLFNKKTIILLIPDYMGLEEKNFENEKVILNLCHGYFTTNQELAKLYMNKFPNFGKPKVLHDLPRLDLIEDVLKEFPSKSSSKKDKVIWVGNSRWGKRQGYVDHKGLASVILPLQKLFKFHSKCFQLQIIDSSKKGKTHFETLIQIRNSDYLIQASNSEGTGLPVLEGIALETKILTTNVGIVPELVELGLSLNIVDKNANLIHDRLHLLKNLKIDNKKAYLKYIEKISEESLVLQDIKAPHFEKFKSNKYIITYFYWRFRYIKALINTHII
jgi:glycosyltransferase involved in cell wall biosynthesis